MLVLDEYVVGARRERRPVADVYDAAHRDTGAPVLVYVLRPRAMADRALVHRVGCEIDAARWIRHAAVPTLDGPGETPSRRLYVAVEHRGAPSLRAVVTERGAVPAHELVGLAAAIVDALEQAHAVGLVHGRLTPDVIGVPTAGAPRGSGSVVLNGLGLASIAHPGDFGPDERAFVSPEQLAGGEPDVSSDVFGLAAVLDFALHGDASRADDRAAADARGTAAGVLRAARAPDPRHRPASVRALWDELLSALVAGASGTGASAAGAATRSDGARLTLSVPMPRTRWRRGAGRAYAGWLALPLLGALGWPLARGGAHAAAPARTKAAGGETAAAAEPAAAAAPVRRAAPAAFSSAEQLLSGQTLTPPPARITRPAPTPSRAVHSPTPPSPTSHATPASTASTTATPQDAAPTNTPGLPRVDVPTFIIIDAGQAQNAPRPVARPGEFEDGIPRARRPR